VDAAPTAALAGAGTLLIVAAVAAAFTGGRIAVGRAVAVDPVLVAAEPVATSAS
jgi:hypothetical protein